MANVYWITVLSRNIEEFLFYHSLNYQAVLDVKNVLIYLAQDIIHMIEIEQEGAGLDKW